MRATPLPLVRFISLLDFYFTSVWRAPASSFASRGNNKQDKFHWARAPQRARPSRKFPVFPSFWRSLSLLASPFWRCVGEPRNRLSAKSQSATDFFHFKASKPMNYIYLMLIYFDSIPNCIVFVIDQIV